MWRITTFTGTVLEVHRFINTESRRWERPVCSERRELWLGTGQDEYKFTIHTKLMPTRKTHCVTLVLAGWSVPGPLQRDHRHAGQLPARRPAVSDPWRRHPRRCVAGAGRLVRHGLGACRWRDSCGKQLAAAVACRYVRRKRLRKTMDDVLNELHVMRVVRPIRSAGRRS